MELPHSAGGCISGPMNHDESRLVLFQNAIEMLHIITKILPPKEESSEFLGDYDESPAGT